MELNFKFGPHILKCDLSKENQLLTPRFAEMLTLKYRPLNSMVYGNADPKV